MYYLFIHICSFIFLHKKQIDMVKRYYWYFTLKWKAKAYTRMYHHNNSFYLLITKKKNPIIFGFSLFPCRCGRLQGGKNGTKALLIYIYIYTFSVSSLSCYVVNGHCTVVALSHVVQMLPPLRTKPPGSFLWASCWRELTETAVSSALLHLNGSVTEAMLLDKLTQQKGTIECNTTTTTYN